MIRSLMFVVLITLTAIANAADPVEVKPPPQKTLSSQSGRFVFGQISDFRSDQFLLDTQSGRLWQIVVDEKGNKKLQAVPIVQIFGGEAYSPDSQQEVETHKAFVRRLLLEEMKK